MNSVTDCEKRYVPRVFVCLACGVLQESARAQQLTCSGRCRVWLHRHPERMVELQTACSRTQATPAMVPEAQAVNLLLPDLAAQILAGTLQMRAARKPVYLAYIKRVMDAAAFDHA